MKIWGRVVELVVKDNNIGVNIGYYFWGIQIFIGKKNINKFDNLNDAYEYLHSKITEKNIVIRMK